MISVALHQSVAVGNRPIGNIYKAGEMLQKPLLFQAAVVTSLITKQNRPNWKVIVGGALSLITLPVTALLALVGTLLRAASPHPVLSISKGEGFQTREEAVVKTYNLGLMPCYIANVNKLAHSEERVPQILGLVGTEDVVCFQECFSFRDNEALVEGLKENFPYIIHSVDEQEFGFGSGLMIASKFEITNIAYHRYTSRGGEDALAHKGALGVTLLLGNGKKMHLYNTHLQAKKGEKYDQIRQAQLDELTSFVNSRKEKEAIDTVVGDFNMNFDGLEGFSKIEGGGTWVADTSQKLDHIFTTGSGSSPQVSGTTTASDHYAFSATIR